MICFFYHAISWWTRFLIRQFCRGLELLDAPRCFNCGSYSHSLKECPKPRDNAAVNNSRKQLKSKRNQTTGMRNATRYYQDSPGGKYEGLRPGILDAETRRLLGLGVRYGLLFWLVALFNDFCCHVMSDCWWDLGGILFNDFSLLSLPPLNFFEYVSRMVWFVQASPLFDSSCRIWWMILMLSYVVSVLFLFGFWWGLGGENENWKGRHDKSLDGKEWGLGRG